jgi:aminoglycoside phosphotransferase (APT) family kinase protein
MMYNLEQAAKRTLAKIIDVDEVLKPLYLQPDRAVFLAENAGIILKVYVEGNTLQQEYMMARKAQERGIPVPEFLLLEIAQPTILAMKQVIGNPLSSQDTIAAREVGKYIEQFHLLGALPPFSGGQMQWSKTISGWVKNEIAKVESLAVFTGNEIAQLNNTFVTMEPLLVDRPIALLHGDLQAEHILISRHNQKVLAFLDFADTQPGDPLLDIAVLSLWDHRLADRVLEGYTSIENNGQTQQLLSQYRLLRHIAEIPWLLNRGFTELANRDVRAVRRILEQGK